MKRNCNLELCLLPPLVSLPPKVDLLNESPNEKRNQQLTIFYNGRISVCYVSELQARAIILLASHEMKNSKTPTSSEASSPLSQSQLYSPTGLSMKRSLQRFLQKRKNRIQATSPYHH